MTFSKPRESFGGTFYRTDGMRPRKLAKKQRSGSWRSNGSGNGPHSRSASPNGRFITEKDTSSSLTLAKMSQDAGEKLPLAPEVLNNLPSVFFDAEAEVEAQFPNGPSDSALPHEAQLLSNPDMKPSIHDTSHQLGSSYSKTKKSRVAPEPSIANDFIAVRSNGV